MRPARGFTLVEFLVAIGLFALVSAIAYGGLSQMLSTRERLDAERAYWTKLALVFVRMQDDFGQVRERGVRDETGRLQAAFIGRQADTRSLAPPTVEFTSGGALLLKDSEGRSDLQRVAYRLSEGVLRRQLWPVLDQGFSTQPVESSLLEDVEDFRVRYFSSQGQWVNAWPTLDSKDTLPRAVEVTLVLRGYGEIVRWWVVRG